MTDDDKARLACIMEVMRSKYCCADWNNDNCNCGILINHIEAQAAEIERMRNWSLKAFTIVEWVVGKGNVLEYPCSDAEPCAICDGVELLGAYPAAHARAALGDEK